MYIIYNMSNIETLNDRLLDLSNRLALKDNMGKDYIKKVRDSLDRIKAKITKILADHNKQVKDITRGSTKNLEKARADLVAQQAQLKQASDAALADAKENQAKLQKDLGDSKTELDKLTEELAKSKPDNEIMRNSINELKKDLQNATDASAYANAQIAQLTERLKAYDGTKEKMDELVKNALNKLGEIIAQVEAMSINPADMTELLRLLNETEDIFPKDDGAPPGGNNDRGNMFSIGNFNLFGPTAGKAVGSGGPAKAAPAIQVNAAGAGERTIYAPPQPKGNFPAGPTYKKGEEMPKEGGKTRRRRGKKTMRGGYVEKLRAKKTRKRARTSKRRSGRKSTGSSSSSSSNSR